MCENIRNELKIIEFECRNQARRIKCRQRAKWRRRRCRTRVQSTPGADSHH